MDFERQVYKKAVLKKIKNLDLKWFISNAFYYSCLKLEKYIRKGYSPFPLVAGLILTEKCTCRCPMCNLPERYLKNPQEQSTLTWKNVISQLCDLGVKGIALSGGEPTTRNDFFELLKFVKDKKVTVTLNSNLLALSDYHINELARNAPDNLNVSIDSGRDDINDKSRGVKNVLPKVLSNIKKLKAASQKYNSKINITIVCVLSDLNVNDLEILFEKISSIGIDGIGFIPLHDYSDIERNSYIVNSKQVSDELFLNIKRLSAKYQVPLANSSIYLSNFHNVMKSTTTPLIRCNSSYTHIIIGSDLKIYRCIPDQVLGQHIFEWNPSKQKLKEIWKHKRYRLNRLDTLKCNKCFHNCHSEMNYLIRM